MTIKAGTPIALQMRSSAEALDLMHFDMAIAFTGDHWCDTDVRRTLRKINAAWVKMRKTRTMNRLASISVFAVRALAALMLVALLAGGSNAGPDTAAHCAGHVHLHLESGEAGLHAQDANCCQPAASNTACVGGCAFACGACAQPSPSLILDQTAEIDRRFPSLRHLAGAMPDLATPPPKVPG